MPQTIDENMRGQVIGGIFNSRVNAKNAMKAFQELGISQNDIQLVVKMNEKQARIFHNDMRFEKNLPDDDAAYFDEAVSRGKILVIVYHISDPAAVIDIFDNFKAEFNPNGSRNVRQDVLGMTTGAVSGAIAGGAVGGVVAGPIGAAAGAATGAVVGGGSGAAAGKAIEHAK